MKLESKRIFISNLPENLEDCDIRKKFAKYGEVSLIEIKRRKDTGPKNQSTLFAFITLAIDNASLQQCFKHFSGSKWKGHHIELQIAKESFLERLKKEREGTKLSERCEKNEDTPSTKNDINNHIQLKSNGISTDNNAYDGPSYKSNYNAELQLNANNKQKYNTSDELKLKYKGEMEVDDIIIKSNKHKVFKEKLRIESVGKDFIAKVAKTEPKSKDPKRAEADQKRIQSMLKMKKGYQQQKLLIQNALSKVDCKPKNKIIFDDMHESVTTSKEKYKNRRKDDNIHIKALFDADDDDGDEVKYTFEVKEQFQGKQGQKLLELQSKYKHDERFALDARFLEDEQEQREVDERSHGEYEEHGTEKHDETLKQLSILEGVLGKKIKYNINESNMRNKKEKVMLRFDPTQPEHVKYELKEQKELTGKKRKRKELDDKEDGKLIGENKPVVSKEKFYKVTGNLKDSLQEKESFSLLCTFGQANITDGKQPTVEQFKISDQKSHALSSNSSNPFKYDTSDDDLDDHDSTIIVDSSINETAAQIQKISLPPFRLWTESFFFKHDDYRLQEGIDFIKKMESDETSRDFIKVRRDMKMIVKAKVRNNQRKNRPFKKKLGGRKKMLKIKKALKQ